MPSRLIVGPRFELFLALAAVLRAGPDSAPWLGQARRKLDPATRRRMGDLALAPAFWLALAAVPGAAALDGDTEAVIAAVADLAPEDFARRCRDALPAGDADAAFLRLVERLATDPAELQQAAVDALRRFDRLAFAALWRRAAPDLEEAARHGIAPTPEGTDAIVFPSLFGEHRFPLGKLLALTLPAERLTAVSPQAPAIEDPELVFRALGDATRYAIARLIAREPLTGAALARRLGVSGPTLTHHLKELRRARLVIEERRGNSILLSLDRGAVATLSSAALATFAAAPASLRRSRKR
ncbi:ArsR/SmtB family transcription factor [Dongia sp. agr-C8]